MFPRAAIFQTRQYAVINCIESFIRNPLFLPRINWPISSIWGRTAYTLALIQVKQDFFVRNYIVQSRLHPLAIPLTNKLQVQGTQSCGLIETFIHSNIEAYIMLIWSPLYKLLQLDLCGQKCYYTVGAAHATLSCECGLNVLKLYSASYYTLVDFAETRVLIIF